MFFLAAQVRAGAGVVNSAVVKTVPEPCLFRVLFVPFSCCFVPLSVWVWLMLHIGHPLRLSPLVRGPWSVVRRVSRWSARVVPLYISPPPLRRWQRGAQRVLGKMRFSGAGSGKKFWI